MFPHVIGLDLHFLQAQICYCKFIHIAVKLIALFILHSTESEITWPCIPW